MDKKSFIKGLLCGIGASLVAFFVAVGVFSCATGATSKKEETSGIKGLRQSPRFADIHDDFTPLYGWRYVDLDNLRVLAEDQAVEFVEGGGQNEGTLDLWGSFKVIAYDGSMWQSDNLCIRWTEVGQWDGKLYVSIPKWNNGDDLDYVPRDNGEYSAVCCGEVTMDCHDIVLTGMDYYTSLFDVEFIERASWSLPHQQPNDLVDVLDALLPSCNLGLGVGDTYVVKALDFVNSLYLHGDLVFRSGIRVDYGSFRGFHDLLASTGSWNVVVGYGSLADVAKPYADWYLNGEYLEVTVGNNGVDSDSYNWLNNHAVRHVDMSTNVAEVVWSGPSFRPAKILEACYGGVLVCDGYGLVCNASRESYSIVGWEFPCLVSFEGKFYDSVRIEWDTIAEGDSEVAKFYRYYDGANYRSLDVGDLKGYSCLAVVTRISLRSFDGFTAVVYDTQLLDDEQLGYAIGIQGYLRGDYVDLYVYGYDAKAVVYTESGGYRLTQYGLWVSPSLFIVDGGSNWFGSAVDPFRLLASGLDTMTSLLGISVLPGLTLGLLFALPLLSVIVVLVFKVIHK